MLSVAQENYTAKLGEGSVPTLFSLRLPNQPTSCKRKTNVAFCRLAKGRQERRQEGRHGERRKYRYTVYFERADTTTGRQRRDRQIGKQGGREGGLMGGSKDTQIY